MYIYLLSLTKSYHQAKPNQHPIFYMLSVLSKLNIECQTQLTLTISSDDIIEYQYRRRDDWKNVFIVVLVGH